MNKKKNKNIRIWLSRVKPLKEIPKYFIKHKREKRIVNTEIKAAKFENIECLKIVFVAENFTEKL